MGARGLAAVVLGVVAAGLVAGCAGRRIEGGVYHSPKGYRVALPGTEWTVAEESEADLELRHRAAPAAMLANASCDGRASTRSLDVLSRHLLLGLGSRTTVERGEVSVNGRRAAHTVVDGRLAAKDGPVRVEAYVLKDERCVYDFAYAAPLPSFDTWRAAFRRFVESFGTE